MTIEYIIPKNKTNIHDFIKKYKNKTFTIKNDKMKMEIEVKLNKIKSAINSKSDFYSITTIEKGTVTKNRRNRNFEYLKYIILYNLLFIKRA